MKRYLTLSLLLALLLSLGGCGGMDVGVISSEDGPTVVFPTDSDQPLTDPAPEDKELPEDSGTGNSEGEELPETPEAGNTEEEEGLPEDPGTGNSEEEQPYEEVQPEEDQASIDEDGTYNSAEDVSLYLYTYGHLPENYITKNEARKLGWTGGSLERYAPGCAIGGDWFGNREGVLPDGNYHECDIDTIGENSRGAKRLVFSDDGRIYYTEDHYATFTLLYGEE